MAAEPVAKTSPRQSSPGRSTNYTPATPPAFSSRPAQDNKYMQDLTTEVQRRAAEWEKEIESLDAKEMEIHQTQLRLIREQNATFRTDFLLVRKQMTEMQVEMKELIACVGFKPGSGEQNLAARLAAFERQLPEVSEDVSAMKLQLRGLDVSQALKELELKVRRDLEEKTSAHGQLTRQCQELEQGLGRHARMHEEFDRKLSSHKQTLDTAMNSGHGGLTELLSKHAKDNHQRHASVDDRLVYLEKCMGDSADKHERHLQELQALHEKHADLKHLQVDMVRSRSEKDEHHASLQERVQFLEQAIGESADRHSLHAQAVEEVRKAHGAVALELERVSREKQSLHAGHATMSERLDYLERSLGDSADRHTKELSDAKSAHARTADEAKALHAKHASVEERLKYLEKSLGDSADRHMQELQGAHAKLEQLHLRVTDDSRQREQHAARDKDHRDSSHASLEQRMKFIEKTIGESADHHARELETHKGKREQAHANLEERLKYLEQTLGDSADRHSKLLEAHRKEMAEHKKDFVEHKNGVQKLKDASLYHASVSERVNYLEKKIGDSADIHHQELEKTKREVETHKRDFADHKAQKEEHHATLEARLAFLEKAVGDSADHHARELNETKARLDDKTKAHQAIFGSFESRLDYVERWFSGFSPPKMDGKQW